MKRETLPGHIKHPMACTSTKTAWNDSNFVFMGYIKLMRLERGKRLMQLLRLNHET